MRDTTQTSQPSTSGGGIPRRRFFWRAATATVIEGLATGIGTRAFAHGGGFCGWQRGGFMRAALETLRADQLKLAEMASQRFTQALADVADVLTPGQRKQLAERIHRWQGRLG